MYGDPRDIFADAYEQDIVGVDVDSNVIVARVEGLPRIRVRAYQLDTLFDILRLNGVSKVTLEV